MGDLEDLAAATQQGPGYSPVRRRRPPQSSKTLVIIAVLGAAAIVPILIGLGVGGAHLANTQTPAAAPVPAAPPEPAEPPHIIPTTARQLANAYRENGVRADRTYRGEILEVTGVVKRVENDLGGNPFVILQGLGLTEDVRCVFDEGHGGGVGALRRGEQITVLGVCAGKPAFDVQLRACELAR